MAGYVAILFGRARRSDDIDFIVEQISEKTFLNLCKEASEIGFTLLQGDIFSENSIKKVYTMYLSQGYSVRFMYREMILPNVELKLALTELQQHAITDSYSVIVNNSNSIRISPLELQIAYKLYLGSDKDIGDAVFLYTLFKEDISREKLYTWCERLNADCKILEG